MYTYYTRSYGLTFMGVSHFFCALFGQIKLL